MMLPTNKYIILAVVLVLLTLAYYYFSGSKEALKSSKKSRTRASKAVRGRKSSNRKKAPPSEEKEEEDDLALDARELYNLVHEPLCKGMQQDEFLEVVGDLADNMVFIDLKQLYNKCQESGKDPMKLVTVEDYFRILEKEL